MPAVFAANREALVASLDNAVRAVRDDGAGRDLAAATAHGYDGVAQQLRDARPDLADADVEAVAKLDYALVQSLGLMWLLNPDALPTGDELARAVAVIAETSAD
jgi:hypothetical protein